MGAGGAGASLARGMFTDCGESLCGAPSKDSFRIEGGLESPLLLGLRNGIVATLVRVPHLFFGGILEESCV